MNKRDFPKIHFYDQDFVDIYNKTWNWIADFWFDPKKGEKSSDGLFVYPEGNTLILNQAESIFSSFFLVYSNRNYSASKNLDYLYAQQEDDGAIRCNYDLTTGLPVMGEDGNEECVGLPLLAWAEFNLYHKSANKRRVKEVVPYLQRYVEWIDYKFKRPNGLYAAQPSSSGMFNSPRDRACYPIDFNAAMAINALHMSSLGDILNDKELSFVYKRSYFSLKTRINSMMWDDETGFYHDLDNEGRMLPAKTIAGFWPLLAEIPNADRADTLIAHLSNPETFGTDHPFPSLSADHPDFSENGEGWRGSVFPAMNFMVVKGLEKYQRYDLARECSIRHLYYILEALSPEGSAGRGSGWSGASAWGGSAGAVSTVSAGGGRRGQAPKGDLYEAYLPCKEGKAALSDMSGCPNTVFPRPRHLQSVALSTIALMIENVIGLLISLPRKTVDWIIPNLEIMGIENLSLKRNLITILSSKSNRGWEIQMESEKLYYFTINILEQKKKTLPIPSGRCSMLIDKL